MINAIFGSHGKMADIRPIICLVNTLILGVLTAALTLATNVLHLIAFTIFLGMVVENKHTLQDTL